LWLRGIGFLSICCDNWGIITKYTNYDVTIAKIKSDVENNIREIDEEG